MKKATSRRRADELRPEYDLSKLKAGVRGKYYERAIAGTNLILIEPELADVFPSSESVNRALRTLVDTAAAAVGQRGLRSLSKPLPRTATKEVPTSTRKAHRRGGR
jgi:hypothetical protein